jgi:8-oxo-dGTP pyrophosphatase MutT (NUDIX family)
VICVDGAGRVLLMCWRDPTDGHLVWEPPGGGIEEGESPIDTARRELTEETGLPGASVLDGAVMVARSVWWRGQLWTGEEAFFLARFAETPALSLDGLLGYETEWLQDHAWVPWDALPAGVEPPDLAAVLARLAPDGPWTPAGR